MIEAPVRRESSGHRLAERLLTERALAWIPGPRLVGVALWSSAQAWLFDLVRPDGTTDSVLALDAIDALVASYLIAVSLAGGRWLVRTAEDELTEIEPLVRRPGVGRWLHGIDSSRGPLALASVFTILEITEAAVSIGPEILLLSPVVFAVHLPIAVAGWALFTVLLALDRIGRDDLHLDPYAGDPNLGLNPAGKVAFTAYALLAAAGGPILLRYTTSAFAMSVNIPVFVAGTLLFVVALRRVHRRMHAARRDALDHARARFLEAYRPLRRRDDLETLKAQATILGAATALEDRVRAVKTWPVTGGLAGQLLIVFISVMTGLVSRGVTSIIGI